VIGEFGSPTDVSVDSWQIGQEC